MSTLPFGTFLYSLLVSKARVEKNHSTFHGTVANFCPLVLSVAFAALIPRLDIFISLVGALSSSTLALLAPPLIDSLLFWDEYKVGGGRRYLLKNAAIFVVGFAGFATGTALSLKKIIEYFETGK